MMGEANNQEMVRHIMVWQQMNPPTGFGVLVHGSGRLLFRLADSRKFRQRQADSMTLRQLEQASVPSVGNPVPRLPHVDRISGDVSLRPHSLELASKRRRAAKSGDDGRDVVHDRVSNRLLDCLASGKLNSPAEGIETPFRHTDAMQKPSASQMKIEFGLRLQLARKAMGFPSCKSLGDALEIEENVVSSWERGARYPQPEKYAAITSTLNVTIDYLFLGETGGLTQQMARILAVAQRNNGTTGE